MKNKNDWYIDYTTKTFFNILEKDNKITFKPISWKSCFIPSDFVDYDINTKSDFNELTKTYQVIYYWYIIISNKNPILNKLEFWCDEDEFQGIHSLTLLKDGELFDNLNVLEKISKKYCSLSELKEINFVENYLDIDNMIKKEKALNDQNLIMSIN
jgi:hypothetical protein